MNIPHHLRILFFKSHVRAYTTKHGVFVAAHEDKRQKKAVPGHKRVENQDGTDLFSAPAAPVADKAKKPTTRDLGKSRLDAFIKKHHGLPNLAHHIGQMTDAERQRIYTEMGKLGNKTPTEVSLMFRGVKPVSAVQEDLFGAGKEKVVKETLLQLAENLASKTSTRERFRSSFDYYFRESEFSDEQRLEVLGILGLKKGGSRADYMAALDKFWSARVTPRKARADGDKKEAKEARERWIIAQLNALIEDAIGHPLKNPLVAMPSEERPPPPLPLPPPATQAPAESRRVSRLLQAAGKKKAARSGQFIAAMKTSRKLLLLNSWPRSKGKRPARFITPLWAQSLSLMAMPIWDCATLRKSAALST